MIPCRLKHFLAALAVAVAVPLASQAPAQQRPEGCVLEAWPAFLDPWGQSHGIREKIPTGAGEVIAVAFGPLSGEFAKVYMFMLVQGGCDRKIVTLASFDFVTDFARERGDIGAGDRIWHLDYFDAQTHNRVELYETEPGYAAARARALELLR